MWTLKLPHPARLLGLCSGGAPQCPVGQLLPLGPSEYREPQRRQACNDRICCCCHYAQCQWGSLFRHLLSLVATSSSDLLDQGRHHIAGIRLMCHFADLHLRPQQLQLSAKAASYRGPAVMGPEQGTCNWASGSGRACRARWAARSTCLRKGPLCRLWYSLNVVLNKSARCGMSSRSVLCTT